MKKRCFLIFSLIISTCAFSQPNFVWAKSVGGTDQDYVKRVCVDGAGNSFVIGEFSSNTFSAAPFSINKTAYSDGFLIKYNTLGEVQWLRGIFGSGFDEPSSVAVDDGGNVYVSGTYTNSLTIGSLTIPASNVNGNDCFLAKFNSSGTPLWLKKISSPSFEAPAKVIIANDGNILITGGFQGLTLQVDNLILNNINLNVDLNDIFLIKFDTDGNVIWGRREGGQGSDIGLALASSSDGSIYLCGYYGSQTMTVGNQTVNNGSNQLNQWVWNGDIYVIKYDSDGIPLWLKSFQGPAHDIANSIFLDSEENLILSGNFSTNVTFDSEELTGSSSPMYLLKLNSFGEVFWARNVSSGNVFSRELLLDSSNNIISAVTYSNIGSLGSITLPSNGTGLSFCIAKFNEEGIVQWTKTGRTSSSSLSIDSDQNSNVYTTLNFTTSTSNFDEQVLTNVTSGWSDGAIAKLSLESLATESFDQLELSIYPNPVNNILYVESKKTEKLILELFDITGRKINEYENPTSINVSELSNGVYFIITNFKTYKFIKK